MNKGAFGNADQPVFPKNSVFLYVLDRFDALISKIIFFKKKYHFDAFQNEKHFEKQPQPHSQTSPIEPLTFKMHNEMT